MTDENQPVADPQFSAAQLIALYIQVRDQKGEMAEKHAAEMKPLQDALNALDAKMMDICNMSGTDALKAKGIGTATKSVKRSASIEDPDSFKNFVITNQRWDMVSWSVKVDAAEQFVSEHKALPPGVKISAYNVMSVRRAPKKAGE